GPDVPRDAPPARRRPRCGDGRRVPRGRRARGVVLHAIRPRPTSGTGARVMTSVAVVAHAEKELGGGLPALRTALARAGVTDPMWREVPKSRKAPPYVRAALDAGANLVVVWGG